MSVALRSQKDPQHAGEVHQSTLPKLLAAIADKSADKWRRQLVKILQPDPIEVTFEAAQHMQLATDSGLLQAPLLAQIIEKALGMLGKRLRQ